MTERRPSLIRRILHEPLLHFALLGAAVFAAYLALHPTAASDERTIVVDRGHLLNFMQNRAKAFDRPHFAEVLDTMSPSALDDLIKDYVREEAMYREAKSLKLEDRDYVARRRLVQQLEIITRGPMPISPSTTPLISATMPSRRRSPSPMSFSTGRSMAIGPRPWPGPSLPSSMPTKCRSTGPWGMATGRSTV